MNNQFGEQPKNIQPELSAVGAKGDVEEKKCPIFIKASRSATRKVARLSDDDDVDFDNDNGEDDAWTVMLVSYSERTKWPKLRKL